MPILIVNLGLITAVLVLLGLWVSGSARRRRRDRRQHTQARMLILQALTGAITPPAPPGTPEPVSGPVPISIAAQQSGAESLGLRSLDVGRLDAVSIAAVLDLLEDRRPPGRGLLTSLATSPRSIWSAGELAGRHLGRRTMTDRQGATEPSG